MKNKELYLWKKTYQSEDMLEYVYLDEKGNRICGNIVSDINPELNHGAVIYMGKAIKHVGTYGNKYQIIKNKKDKPWIYFSFSFLHPSYTGLFY